MSGERTRLTSVDKALELCEALSVAERGMSVGELARALRQPPSSVHRLLATLKRRGYVRQDEETARYSLSLKMLDLSFRLLGRSELRLHAYPVLREYALASGHRSFIAIPTLGEVTYVWSTGPDEVAMHTMYGREMPGHCSIYFDPAQATRRLSCLRLARASDGPPSTASIVRLGPRAGGHGGQRLLCTCAAVRDYSGREVARVGVFRHGADDGPLASEHGREAWELARLISVRLGHLPTAPLAVTA
jgi:hypothetical protein